MTGRSLAEDLAVVALSPPAPVPTHQLDRALPAATIVDLVLRNRVDVVDGRVRLVDPAPTDDGLLDEQLDRVGRHPRAPHKWVGASGGAHVPVLDRLAAAGLVRVEPKRVFRPAAYEAVDPEPPRRLRADLRAALLGTAPLDARAAALAALTVAAGMAGRLVIVDERADVRERVGRALGRRRAAVEALCAAIRYGRDDDGGWVPHVGGDGSPDGGVGGADGGAGGDGGGGGGGD